tara:strand:+ start:1771 stop:3633 length:1863 start_codon:yes stop_codon:yes gene_type:complete
MTTYRKIHGRAIKSVSSNLSAPSAEGQIWFNTTDNKFRSAVTLEAWSAGANTIVAKQRPGATGTQTAGLACGGFPAPPISPGAVTSTEEYNGTGWSSGGNLNTARGNTQLIGTQTAAAFIGKGSPLTPYAGTTELYNGTAWTTNPNSANDAYNYRSGCGTTSAGLITGGNYPPTNRAAGNEHFDGTSFSEGGDLPQKQSSNGQAGTQTAAINSFGSTNNPASGNSGDADNAISLEYDGSSWTAGPNGRGVVDLVGYSMGAGTQTDALFAGAPSTNSCKYDGTTFTVGPALAVAQDSCGQSQGPAGAGWIAHGSPVPSVGSRTQEFNKSANVITAAAWAAGGSLNTTRRNVAGAGIQTSALAFGGESPKTGKTELYNGTSWSEVADLNTARNTLGGTGTSTAAIAFGGEVPGGPSNATETWDGSSWTNSPNSLNTPVRSNMGFGTTASAINMGGFYPSPTRNATVEEWGGTSWTTVTSLPTATVNAAGFGIETAGVCAGGNVGSETGNTYEWGGSSWTTGGTMNTARSSVTGGTGTATAGLVSGGSVPGATALVEGYDGTSWSSRPSLGTARMSGAGLGPSSTQTAGLVAGGYAGPPGDTNVTEEFTGETTSLNVKDLTQS